MSFRFGAVGVFLLALVLGGCASGGSEGPSTEEGGAVAAAQFDEEDLPQWVEDLPEGTPPRDDEHTDQSFFFLAQAMTADGETAEQHYRRALEHAEAGIAADPENPQPYYQAGEAYLGLQDYEEAARMLDRAEEIYPRYILETELLREQAWIELFNEGAELSQAGDTDAAAEYFERAHSIYEGRPEAMLNLAEIRTAQGRLDDAIELYSQSLEVMADERADDLDEELRQQWDEFAEIARYNVAQLLFRQQRYAEAAEVYEELVAANPDDLALLSNLAASLVSSGREAEARELYDDLLSRPDLDAQDYYMIGVGLYQAEEWEQSARAFGEALDRIPAHRDALFNYAQTLYLADDHEALVELADDLLAADPYNENAYRFVAQALAQQERQEEALARLEEMEALPFFIEGMELMPLEGAVAVLGFVTNRTEASGTPVDLHFTFYGLDGETVGTSETTVQLGEEGEPVQFQAELSTSELVFGFSYEVP